MPIYEYRCESCGNELEKIQKFSDSPLTDCPECGKAALKKLVSASSFRLKGTGWYETDFKNKKKPESKGSSKDNGADSSQESGGKGSKDGKDGKDSKEGKNSSKDSGQDSAKTNTNTRENPSRDKTTSTGKNSAGKTDTN